MDNLCFACRFCGEIGVDLTKHFKKHTGGGPFRCGQCNFIFGKGRALRVHIKCMLNFRVFKFSVHSEIEVFGWGNLKALV